MARHVLTHEEKRRGLEAAIASRKTPRHLKTHLRRALRELESGKPARKSPRKSNGFLGFFTI